jgi:hypothetical protein
MASVSSQLTTVSPGIADLFKTLPATAGSPLSSPGLQSVLEDASPRDIVQISSQALQLQEASNLFGTATSASTTSTDPASLLLQAVNSSLTGST